MPAQSSAEKSGTNVAAAVSQAQSIVEAARERAAAIVKEAEEVKQQAQEEGYQQGYQQAQIDLANTAIRLIDESSSVSDALAEEAVGLALAIWQNYYR